LAAITLLGGQMPAEPSSCACDRQVLSQSLMLSCWMCWLDWRSESQVHGRTGHWLGMRPRAAEGRQREFASFRCSRWRLRRMAPACAVCSPPANVRFQGGPDFHPRKPSKSALGRRRHSVSNPVRQLPALNCRSSWWTQGLFMAAVRRILCT
jgi:hypothetical protein